MNDWLVSDASETTETLPLGFSQVIVLSDLFDPKLIERNRTTEFLVKTANELWCRLNKAISTNASFRHALQISHADFDPILFNIMEDLELFYLYTDRSYDDVAAELNLVVDRLYDWADCNQIKFGDE